MNALTPWVRRLLIANFVVFMVIQTSPGLYRDLAFYPPVAIFRPWTIVTYMFLHAGFGHIFFNMLGLFFFGPRLEERLGGKGFLGLYFAAGIGGALLQTIATALAAPAPMVGASGGIYGILVGFAMYWPREKIFVIPIPFPIEARILVTGYVVLSLVQGVGSVGAGIAHFAHLGGAAAAFGFVRWWNWKQGSAKRDFQKKMRTDPSPAGFVGDRIAVARWKGISVDRLHELNREEVERLLAKVTNEGPGSLSRPEREFLDRMAGAG
jgi:membrane associated rhomboid family serine protease